MADRYDEVDKRTRGAWTIHHAQKTAATQNAAAEFPALDTAGKAANLLSQLAANDQEKVEQKRVAALAQAAGLNTRLELPGLLKLLQDHRLIDQSINGDVEVLGLTTNATVGHAADIFDSLEPTSEEKASIVIAEITSTSPQTAANATEYISDQFKIPKLNVKDILTRYETIGFIDAEGNNSDKLYFNGNLFRRDNIMKTTKVLSSLSDSDNKKIAELDERLTKKGCLAVVEVERLLEKPLFEKLMAAGMYDVNTVSNASGEFGFVTKPAAFHKFSDPVIDDAFDLAKALVAALTFGMTQSSYHRGRIAMIGNLLRKLIKGETVGPASAIGEDYRVLEYKGVLRVTPASPYGYFMRLLKRDVGEMALKVLTTGETAAAVVDRPLPGSMQGYTGPEASRSHFRQKRQPAASKKHTFDVLTALRTEGL